MIGLDVEQAGTVTVAHVMSDIDAANAASLQDTLTGCMPHAASDLVIDLTDSYYLDSAGIDMLFQLNDRLRQRRRSLRLVIPPDSHLARLADIVALPRAMPVHGTVAEAISATSEAPGTAMPATERRGPASEPV